MSQTMPSPSPDEPQRRPRIALMGEFSAGKSTLANLLLGEAVSPVRVTATQLPPIWYSHGPPGMIRIATDGTEIAIAASDLPKINPRDTQAIRASLETDVLEFCDLIDMPGTSDPNMPPDVWDSMLKNVDGVVWCTSSSQAWRQSEAALWEQMPEHLRPRSIMLITRMDKLLTERDRNRVVARVRHEAHGLFASVLPIALTDAIEARDDPQLLIESGAEDFATCLIDLVESLGQELSSGDASHVSEFASLSHPPRAARAAPPKPPQADLIGTSLKGSQLANPRHISPRYGDAPLQSGPTDAPSLSIERRRGQCRRKDDCAANDAPVGATSHEAAASPDASKAPPEGDAPDAGAPQRPGTIMPRRVVSRRAPGDRRRSAMAHPQT